MAEVSSGSQLSSAVSDHPAPNASREHSFWRGEFRRSNLDEQTLRNIFWLIDASDHLLGIEHIAGNMIAILELIFGNPTIEDSDLVVFRGWERVLQRLAATTANREKANPNGNACYLRSPLWSLLWEVAEDPIALKCYRILQGHLLLAHAKYLSRESLNDPELSRDQYERYGGKVIWPAFPDSPYEAAMRIRMLARDKWTRTLLRIEANLSPLEFIKSFRRITASEESLAANWLLYRGAISSFIARAHGFEPWSIRSIAECARVSAPKRTFDSTPVNPGDPDDDDARWPNARVISAGKPLTEKQLEEYVAADLDPDDFRDAEDCFVAAATDPAAFQQLAIDSALAARGQLRHVQMDHQALVWRYKEAATSELAQLMRHTRQCWEELPQPEQWRLQEREIAETITILQVILWTGRTLEEALDLTVVYRSEEAEQLDAGRFLYILDAKEWQVDVQPPPYSRKIEAPSDQVHPHLRILRLQDVAGTGTYINALLGAPHVHQGGESCAQFGTKGVRVFDVDLVLLEQMVRKFLLEGDPSGRLTLQRVGSALLNQMVARTGDQMPGALITGRFGTLTRTERFYACYPLKSLGETYYQICRWMITHLTGQPVPQLCQSSNTDGYGGARLCARSEAVERAVQSIGEAIDEAEGKKGSGVLHHNLLTLYTVMWFGMATSCRAIRTPYIPVSRVDPETGFAYLCDKDDDAHHKTRLVWIPPELILQMKRYKNHCKRLARENVLVRDWTEPCFFLHEHDGRTPIEVRPKTLSKYMHKFLQVPPNFHRKFMRDQLIGAGGELVSYWLGHAFQGEELWNPHSALSPSAYRESLSALLPELLRNLGWKVR